MEAASKNAATVNSSGSLEQCVNKLRSGNAKLHANNRSTQDQVKRWLSCYCCDKEGHVELACPEGNSKCSNCGKHEYAVNTCG
jgi:hypothetical protein